MGRETFDIVVIGGGITGAGCALDAVTRGLSVALVEGRDFAAGTSSRSSKLIHGGLRYLEMLDFGLVREALRERRLLLTHLAPHLVRPVPFLYPLSHRVWERAYVGAGLALYDTLGGSRVLPRHRHLSRRRALQIAPGLRKDALIGAVQYHDAMEDDARYTLTVARTAAHYGAVIGRGLRATGFVRDSEGRITGLTALDLTSGTTLSVGARQVINATGVWTDDTQELGGVKGRFHVRASKGVHLVVPRDRIALDTGLILRTATSVLFVIPWGRHWIIGTTDTDWTLHKEHPAASKTDIEYLLHHVNEVLRQPLSADDVEGVYAGLRPLLAGESESTSKLSRTHAVSHAAPGLISIAGGKYTTYRVMAKDAVDLAGASLGGAVAPSCTHNLPLVGAEGYQAWCNDRHHLARRNHLPVTAIEHLLGRYGSRIEELLTLVAERPELGRPLPGAEDYLQVEAVYAVTHEAALHVEDVLTRRTRISIETFDRGIAASGPVARLMAGPLGWDDTTTALEIERYGLRVEAERESQRQADDLAAETARLGAPDIM